MSHPIDRDVIRQEFFHLQQSMDDYDQRTLPMKGWSVPASLASVVAAFTKKRTYSAPTGICASAVVLGYLGDL